MKKEIQNSVNTTISKEDTPCPFEDGKCLDCGEVTKPLWVFDKWHEAADRCSDCIDKIIEKERHDQKIAEIFNSCELEIRHHQMELENFNALTETQKTILNTLKRYGPGDGNVFIHGSVGTGKTHLIVGLVKKIAREYLCSFRFKTGVDMLYKIRSTFNYGDPGETDRMIGRFTKIGILVIDDLGTEKSTEWARETFYMIIDRRYNMMKRTFITSNLSPKALADKLNDRLVSRLIEGATILKIDGDDYRLRR